jgi:LmbE family N-acetylglucosaminyl deacetylase
MQANGDRWSAKAAREAFAAAPTVSLDALCRNGRMLVVAPHPDDETLGCGGLIALAAQAGREVVVAALTDGAASHPRSRLYPPDTLAQVRRDELRRAVEILGDGRVETLAFGAPDGELRDFEPGAQTWLSGFGPFACVFTTWAADPHPDHQAAYRIARGVAAQWRARLYAYPVWGLILEDDADAGPRGYTQRLDVGSMLQRKRRAIAAHASQTGGLITDDPRGFRLTEADMTRHLGPFEIYIANPRDPI